MKNLAQLSVCVIALFFAHRAQAQVWFQDDFESNTTVNTAAYPTTDPPPAAGDFDPDAPTVGTWGISPEDDPEWAQVSSFTGGDQPDFAHSGNNYLIAGHNGDISNTFDAQGIVTATLAGGAVSQATVEFWMWQEPWTQSNNQFGVVRGNLTGAGGGRAWELTFETNERVKWNSNGGNGGTLLPLELLIVENAWNHIIVDYDGVAQSAIITINDVASTQPTLPVELFPNTFNAIQFRPEHHGFYDDILVSTASVLVGDFDGDSDVDGRDFLVWQRGESPNPLSASDLADWQANYGPGSLAAAVRAVPEPTSLALVVLAVVASACRRKR